VSLSGKQMLKAAKPAAFAVSLRNDGDETCLLSLAKPDFELRINDGKKVLWSSRACSTATFIVSARLELDQSVSWLVPWDARGVAAGCLTPGAPLERGTYAATAQVSGVKAVKMPVTVR
jgi:hypothetical protein